MFYMNLQASAAGYFLFYLLKHTFLACELLHIELLLFSKTLCSRSLVSILNKASREHSRRGGPPRKNLKGD